MKLYLATSGSELINPGIGLVFWMLITFVILLFLLKKFAWGPILKAINSREETIKESLAAAEKARADMQNLKADNEKMIQEARAEREAMLKEAREIKERMIADSKEQAKLEGDKMIQQAQATIESEKLAAVAEIKGQVAELSVSIAEKLIKEQLSGKDKQMQLVDTLLGDIKLS